VAGYTRAAVGESAEWTAVVNAPERNRTNYSRALSGKTLCSALYGPYTVTLNDLRTLRKVSSTTGRTTETETEKPTQEEDLKDVQRREKRSNTESAPNSKEAAAQSFAPLQATIMDTDSSVAQDTTLEEAVTGKAGRPPPIILKSKSNLIQLQRQLKNVVKRDFEFRNTNNVTRVSTRSISDFEDVESYFFNKNLSYYSFFPRSRKPIKADVRHLPANTPAEDTSDGLVTLGFDVVRVKRMNYNRRSPPEGTTRILHLFLITLPRTAKPEKIFKLQNFCHISIRV
jgi:hypothetical protein